MLCLAFTDALAQSASLQMGARSQGMGYASGCLSDVWALTNNIAGLAQIKTAQLACSYNALPSAQFFDRISAAFALPFRTGAGGASVFRFGDDLYSEQILSIGASNTFGLASLGLKVNYIQYRAEGFATQSAFTFSFGGLATITPQLSFGAHILNINQPVINVFTGERVPTRLHAGMAFKLSEKFIAATEIEKDLRYPPILKGGMEYLPFKKIAFRTGVNLHPQSGFFGLGFKVKKFNLDYALEFNRTSGLNHQASVAVALKE